MSNAVRVQLNPLPLEVGEARGILPQVLDEGGQNPVEGGPGEQLLIALDDCMFRARGAGMGKGYLACVTGS